jgi:bifunctional DNA-binding transcriptional regulator/antitoxin component of YhaV-PrlF toxin-antitoxin module
MITVIGQTKIIKGCVKLPNDLRMKYKMYEYSPVTFIEMEDGIMIKSLISNTENGVKRTIGNKVVTKYPDLEKEIVTVMKSIEAFSK